MKQKTFLEYAVMVVVRAASKAWDKIGALGTGLGLTVSIIVAYLAEKPKSLADFGSSEAIMAALFFVLLFICAMGFYILREPFIIHNEQQVSKEKLEQKLNKLEEAAKPKLEIKFAASDTSLFVIKRDLFGKAYAFGFQMLITNIASMESVEGIEINLVKVDINTILYDLPAKLRINYDHEKRLNAGDNLYVDVMGIKAPHLPDGETQYTLRFEIDNKNFHFPPFQFTPPLKFTIKASGINISAVEKTFELFSLFENNETILNLREVNNHQAKTL